MPEPRTMEALSLPRASFPTPRTDLLGVPRVQDPRQDLWGAVPLHSHPKGATRQRIPPGPWRQGLVGAVAREPEPAQPPEQPLPFFLPFLLLQAPHPRLQHINPSVPSKPVQAGGPRLNGPVEDCRSRVLHPRSHPGRPTRCSPAHTLGSQQGTARTLPQPFTFRASVSPSRAHLAGNSVPVRLENTHTISRAFPGWKK